MGFLPDHARRAREEEMEGMEDDISRGSVECMRSESSTGRDISPSSDTAVKVGPASSRT